MKTSIKKGYTLVELMVSVSIFSIVMVASMGAILSIIDANRKAQALSNVMNNLNASIEEMTRSIKTNTGYENSRGNSTSLSVKRGENQTISYYLDEDNERIMKSINNSNPLSITAPDVKIKGLDFLIEGGDRCQQPYVVIRVWGEAGIKDGKDKSEFFIQTAVSQRNLNIESCI